MVQSGVEGNYASVPFRGHIFLILSLQRQYSCGLFCHFAAEKLNHPLFEAIFLFSRKITFRAGTFFHILVMTMLPNDTLTVRCSDNLGNRFSSFSVKDSLYYRFITNQKKRNNTLFIILTTHCRFVCKNSRTYFRHSRRDTGDS